MAKKEHIKIEESIRQLVDQYFHIETNSKKQSNLHQGLINRVERELIKSVLSKTNDNQSQAARILGLSRTTLRKKIDVLKIKNTPSKPSSVKKNVT